MATKPTVQPLFAYVLVRPLKHEAKTASGIVLPDTVKEKPQMGEIMAIGDGECCAGCDCKTGSCKTSMVVKVGQKVVYKKWGGNEIKVENEEWLLIEQKDIMAVIK